MRNLTKLAIAASIVGAAYYVIKSNSEKAEVAIDGEEVFEGDIPVETEETAEATEKKIEIYKQKATELAKKTAAKATEFGKVVAEKAGEAKTFVEKKIDEYKKQEEEAAEEAEGAVEEAVEFVGDTVEDFVPAEDPVDPEV